MKKLKDIEQVDVTSDDKEIYAMLKFIEALSYKILYKESSVELCKENAEEETMKASEKAIRSVFEWHLVTKKFIDRLIRSCKVAHDDSELKLPDVVVFNFYLMTDEEWMDIYGKDGSHLAM